LRWLGAAAAALTLVGPIMASSPASADPISTKQAQADALAKQLQVKGDKVSQLAEQVDQARLRSAELDDRLHQAQAGLDAATLRAQAVRDLLRQQAINAYMRGASQGDLNPAVHSLDVAVQHTYVATMASAQQETLDEVRASKLALDDERAKYQAAKKAADAALHQVSASQKAAAKAQADTQALLDKIKGQLADLVAKAQARQAASDAARVQADLAARQPMLAVSRSSGQRGAPSDATTADTPVAPGAAGAIQEAQRQLGKMYQYGAAGPDRFDCSGLTMWAWGHAGRSLPHSAAAQYGATTHVPLSAIQPGDLLFYGSDLHHVGLYVGNGQMIEASHTGTPVRYASIYRSDLVGAGRP
jgi:cell wall-associated NlpC family hydrolase